MTELLHQPLTANRGSVFFQKKIDWMGEMNKMRHVHRVQPHVQGDAAYLLAAALCPFQSYVPPWMGEYVTEWGPLRVPKLLILIYYGLLKD